VGTIALGILTTQVAAACAPRAATRQQPERLHKFEVSYWSGRRLMKRIGPCSKNARWTRELCKSDAGWRRPAEDGLKSSGSDSAEQSWFE